MRIYGVALSSETDFGDTLGGQQRFFTMRNGFTHYMNYMDSSRRHETLAVTQVQLYNLLSIRSGPYFTSNRLFRSADVKIDLEKLLALTCAP